MAWDNTARRELSPECARYPGDLTDAEWALIAPLFCHRRNGAGDLARRRYARLNAILYLASSRCQWRMLPKDFSPVSTVLGYFYDWRDRALLATINVSGSYEFAPGRYDAGAK